MTPPNGAMPRVWWHWMNGNITRNGIRKDLEWMHRSGIGGFQNFDAALATPQIVEKRLTYMTPEWKDAFQFTTKLADSLHLEMAIAGSPGWSESGGPWVKPEDGMKKIVWSETFVRGGAANIVLSKAPSITGPFQNIPLQPGFGAEAEQKCLQPFTKTLQ
ncbi:MAG: glycosyl hydrolase [Segetibacter sp.]